MIATIAQNNKNYKVDLSKPIDISIALKPKGENVHAWYIPNAEIKPVSFDDKQMLVTKGAPVNFNTIKFNPHAHITHTECAGHITKEIHSVNKHLKNYFFLAELISITPQKKGDDLIITKKQVKKALTNTNCKALVIRLTPNDFEKTKKQYSHTNPPYFLEEVAEYLKEIDIKHILVDVPSVDKENDNGELLFHNSFWNTMGEIRFDTTITEFIYAPNSVKDGSYLLNLMIAPFENDASPSKPILYKIL